MALKSSLPVSLLIGWRIRIVYPESTCKSSAVHMSLQNTMECDIHLKTTEDTQCTLILERPVITLLESEVLRSISHERFLVIWVNWTLDAKFASNCKNLVRAISQRIKQRAQKLGEDVSEYLRGYGHTRTVSYSCSSGWKKFAIMYAELSSIELCGIYTYQTYIEIWIRRDYRIKRYKLQDD